MMAGHRQCDAKHHIDAYLMVKVWTYGIDVSLQSQGTHDAGLHLALSCNAAIADAPAP